MFTWYECEFKIPLMTHIASSLSSVIYPDPSLNGPPPFINMQFIISSSVATYLMNSKNEPQASPVKAPMIQPKALSSKESVSI